MPSPYRIPWVSAIALSVLLLPLLLGCSPAGEPDDTGGDSSVSPSPDDSTVSPSPVDQDRDLDGYSLEEGDCNDQDPAIHPDAGDACDGVDNDCDGLIDEDLDVVYYRDVDGDGYGNPSMPRTVCVLTPGYALVDGDCDDADPTINPDAEEVCDDDDNDCDGYVDEGLPTVGYYVDEDMDGFGEPNWIYQLCAWSEGYVLNDDDCDDDEPLVYPGADETCNELDDDCDGMVDEEVPGLTFYRDGDGDGYGISSESIITCPLPAGYVTQAGDCDDDNGARHPGAIEVCDHIDQDCDSVIDEGRQIFAWFADLDGDSFGAGPQEARDCAPPAGYSPVDTDCDDGSADVYPGADETCDGIDEDCDDVVDGGAGIEAWPDADGDGFGAEAGAACVTGQTVTRRGDCDDTDPAIHPGTTDPAGDGIDQDCGGSDGPQPYMHLGEGAFTTLAEALQAARDGDTVWIGPGNVAESELSFAGKGIRLRATEVGLAKIFAIELSYTVGIRFESGETADALLDGLAVTATGSAVRVVNAHPTLRNCTFYESYPGIYLEGSRSILSRNLLSDNWSDSGLHAVTSAPTVSACQITANYSYDNGAGVVLEGSSPLITGTVIRDNIVYGRLGAGAYIRNSAPLFDRSRVEGNWASASGPDNYGNETPGDGAGLYLEASSATLVDSSISENVVETAYSLYTEGRGVGGGVLASASGLVMTGCVVDRNIAGSGAAIHLSNSSLSISTSAIRGNISTPFNVYHDDNGNTYNEFSGVGAGIFGTSSFAVVESTLLMDNSAAAGGAVALVEGSAASLQLVDVVSNHVDAYSDVCGENAWCGIFPYGGEPGGVWLDTSLAWIADSILAYNESGNLLGGAAAELTYSNLYNPSYWSNADVVLEGTNLALEPQFLRYADSRDERCEAGSSTSCLPTDVHLSLGSPLVDIADPGLMDVDGTRADPGIYGGPAGATRDLDRDGFPDWFWPGKIDDAPEGFERGDFDWDDLDPELH